MATQAIHQAVTATLGAAGLQAAVRTRRQRRSGYTVRQSSARTCHLFEWDFGRDGRGAERFARGCEALVEAGWTVEVVNHQVAKVTKP